VEFRKDINILQSCINTYEQLNDIHMDKEYVILDSVEKKNISYLLSRFPDKFLLSNDIFEVYSSTYDLYKIDRGVYRIINLYFVDISKNPELFKLKSIISDIEDDS